MQYNQGFIEFSGLFRYIVLFISTVIAGLLLYIIILVLTAIAVYFIKKNDVKEFVTQHGRSNLVYLNSASKQWHQSRRRI